MKIVTIVGARPQFIKAAAVSRAFAQCTDIQEVIVHTGQHYDANMSDVFFDEMQIPRPAYNLAINGLAHGAMTGQMLEGIERVLQAEQPDWVLVYGDTNSTLAGALAAKKMHIKVAHVEAGLRSYNMRMPEEVNRILTDRISDLLLCPTENAVAILEKEGFAQYPSRVVRNGDVMQDAALFYAQTSAQKSNIIAQLGVTDFVLATLHREENTNDPAVLRRLVTALNDLHRERAVVLPLHPRTRKLLVANDLQLEVCVTDPLGYFDMIELLKHCSLVLTDSGGLQKEAFFFGKHAVVLREQTEWVELVERGFNLVVGSDIAAIKAAYSTLLARKSDFSIDLYGNGQAAQRVAQEILSFA
jgi:UDP-GlcNAc3NAcA epimerase